MMHRRPTWYLSDSPDWTSRAEHERPDYDRDAQRWCALGCPVCVPVYYARNVARHKA